MEIEYDVIGRLSRPYNIRFEIIKTFKNRDEALKFIESRKENKKWWQFWKRAFKRNSVLWPYEAAHVRTAKPPYPPPPPPQGGSGISKCCKCNCE